MIVQVAEMKEEEEKEEEEEENEVNNNQIQVYERRRFDEEHNREALRAKTHRAQQHSVKIPALRHR